MRIRSLPFKINTAILITATVIAVVFLIILYPVERKRHANERERIFLLLDTIYKQKQNDLANEIFADQQRALKATLLEIKGIREEILNVCLYRENGDRYLCYDNTGGQTLERSFFTGVGKKPVFRQGTAQGLPLGTYVNSIEVIGATVGYIAISYNLTRIEQEGRALFLVFFLLLLATSLIMALLQNIFLFRAIIKPVSRLRNAMRRVEEGHLGEVVELPWRDEIGEMGKAFNDMSQQLLKSKEDVKKAEGKYRDIFEQSIEGIFQSLPDHSGFITVNPSLAHILGFKTPEELLESVSDIGSRLFFSRTDWEHFQQGLDSDGRIVGVETRLARAAVPAIWVAISARKVFAADGRHVYNEGSIVDITERRQREQAEREREAAEAANRAKSEFLAKMSHEIRTPLHAILGFAEILESSLEDQQKGYARTIKASGDNLLQLINDILDLSKIEAGKMEIVPVEVDVRALLRKLTEVFSVHVQQKGIEMHSLVETDVPGCLLLDVVRLRQILFNLIGNAVKFTDHGSVEIHVSALGGSAADTVDLIIRVADTGIGIAPEAGREIFESFKQLHSTGRPAIDGTGLGLTISKNLAEAMGGDIQLASRPGAGSAFTVSIPGVRVVHKMDAEDGRRYAEDGARRFSFREATVLIADDLEINRKLLKAAFADSPVRIVEAQDGRMAVAMATEHQPDLILMDIRMPGLDGHEAYMEIRKNPALRKTPIVALTASGMKEDIDSIRQTGFDDYLIRPCNIVELKEKMSIYLGVGRRTGDGGGGPAEMARLPSAVSYLVDWDCSAEIFSRLEEIKMHEWRKVRRNQRLSDIRAFSEHIGMMGIENDLESLTAYGQALGDYVEVFDIDNIHRTLEDFPELLAHRRR